MQLGIADIIDTPTRIEPRRRTSPYTPRAYQTEDVDAVFDAWADGKRGVMCRQATGLGKSVFLAMIAARARQWGRVLVLVDVTNLSADLCQTITAHTGKPVGVLTGKYKEGWASRDIVVGTVQTFYSGRAGQENYRQFDPAEFGCVCVDEAEGSIAEKYSSVVRWFLQNPALKLVGCTATPFRGDGRGMIELYDHAEKEQGVLNRDILWSVMEGWLVKPKQAFCRCELDFSTLKLRKNSDGDRDYSEADIAKLLEQQDEAQWLELAKSIHGVAKGEPSIVICPNSVEVAKTVAHYLDGAADADHIARAIYGKQGDEAQELIDAYKAGAFPYAVSVNKLYKGFDADHVKYCFMLRKTRSRRLYEQAMGRTVRPLAAIRDALNSAESAEERRNIILASDKPSCCMVDLVGVAAEAKDLGVIDILGEYLPDETRRRTMKKMLDHKDEDELDVGELAREARDELKAEALEAQRRADEEAARRRRRLIQVDGKLHIEYSDDLGARGNQAPVSSLYGATAKQVNLLIAFGVKPETALRFGKRQAGKVIETYKAKSAKPDWSRVRRYERDGGVDTMASASYIKRQA